MALLAGAAAHGARTHFVVDDVDLDAIRELRAAAAARVAEMPRGEARQELEAELAVLDAAQEESSAPA